MKYFSEDSIRVAKGLASARGFSEGYKAQMPGGFDAPLWVAYLSEAERVVQDQQALKFKS